MPMRRNEETSEHMTAVYGQGDTSVSRSDYWASSLGSDTQMEFVSPRTAFEAATGSDRSLLLDIRTNAEWCLVGIPDLENVMFLEWRDLAGDLVSTFVDELTYWAPPEMSLYVLSRSGDIRAGEAAAAALRAGFRVFVVAGGFEGPLGRQGHRGECGWKAEGLPWRQW